MKVLIIDGTNLLFRGYFASKNTGMNNGTKMTGATYFSLNMFSSIKAFIEFNSQVDKIVFAFDNKTSKIPRLEMFEHYKGNRDHSKNEGIFSQIDDFKELIKFSDYHLFDEENLEADDICGAVAEKYLEDEEVEHIYIYSSDKDFYQFLNEKTTIIKAGFKGDLIEYDYLSFDEEFQMDKEQYIDFKAICGDPSDNIPGIRGLGLKGIQKLFNKYYNIDGWFEDKEEGFKSLPKWIRTEVLEQKLRNWEDTKIKWLEEIVKKENGEEEKKDVFNTIKGILEINKRLMNVDTELKLLEKKHRDYIFGKINKISENKKGDSIKIREMLDELKMFKMNTKILTRD